MPGYRDDSMRILTVLFGGVLLLFLIAGGYAAATKGVGAAAGGALIIVAGSAIGLLFGLLFGAPHSSGQSSTTGILVLNTSFDQMSDWLTKILVGVGLTQLVAVPSRLQALGNFLAPAVGGTEAGASFATTLALGSAVLGFLISFVFTKLVLSPDLADAGYETLKDRAQKAVNSNPGAQTLAPRERQRAANLAENLAKVHLTRQEDVMVLDPSLWDDIADQAIAMVNEDRQRSRVAHEADGNRLKQ